MTILSLADVDVWMSVSRTRVPSAATALMTGLVILVGCRGETVPQETSVTDSAGVALVTNSTQDQLLAWTAERVLEIRPLSEEGNGFFGVQELDVLDGDRIVVLDGDGKRVVAYDENGTFQAQYGREGSGPGEFQLPFEMAATPGGGVVVYDVLNQRLEYFDADLQPQAQERIRVKDYFGGHLAYSGSFLVVPTRSSEDPDRPLHGLTAVNTTDTVPFVSFEREEGRAVTFESCGMSLSGMGPIFEPRTLWAVAPGGRVVVAGTSRYELDVYRGPSFSLERRIRRDVPTIEATAAMAESSLGEGMRFMTPTGIRVCDVGEVVEQRGFAPEVPPIEAFAVSPAGEIFIQRWSSGEEDRPTDLLSLDGEYLGTLPAGFPFPEAFLGDDRILVAEEGDLGLRSVVVYRIVR